jgi:hypothetical protein
MKNILVIMLAMFVGISVVGCASNQKIDRESIYVCNYLYKASTEVGYVDIFYDNLSKRMKDEGLLPVNSFRGRLFMEEFLINRDEYVLFVEVSIVSDVSENHTLNEVPYFTISLKKRNLLGVNYRCVAPDDITHLVYYDAISKIVNGSALFSKKENWVEESK